jgi:heparan-alpha-glucosaminide N-acetyltransferase
MNSTQESDPGRLRSVDAFRGFVMLAMVSGGIATFGCLSSTGDGEMSIPLEIVLQQLDHVQWRGCVFWDLIQPSFMFLVGVSMPFSYSSRRARGDHWLQLFGHAVLRSLVLVALAVFLASHGGPRTDYSFTNVLGQIGLGYCFTFLVLGRPPWFQLAAALLILFAYWLLFALYPLPGPKFPYGLYGANEPQLMMKGFFAHWNKNTNVAADFDRWFLNLFPHPSNVPFRFNPGGYATLNFIPSIATMIFGVLAGELLKSRPGPISKPTVLLLAGALLWALGQVMDGAFLPIAKVCPIVKRIWTPSWVIASSAWTCWMLAAFYWVIDVCGFKLVSLPLAAVGANSIAIYLMSQLMRPFVEASLKTHVDKLIFVGPYGPLVKGLCVLTVLWFICVWLYHRRIFIKI